MRSRMAAINALKAAYEDSSGSDGSDEEPSTSEDNLIHLRQPVTAAAKLQLVQVQSAPDVITKVNPIVLSFFCVSNSICEAAVFYIGYLQRAVLLKRNNAVPVPTLCIGSPVIEPKSFLMHYENKNLVTF